MAIRLAWPGSRVPASTTSSEGRSRQGLMAEKRLELYLPIRLISWLASHRYPSAGHLPQPAGQLSAWR
jgi:hypothetical protein